MSSCVSLLAHRASLDSDAHPIMPCLSLRRTASTHSTIGMDSAACIARIRVFFSTRK
ncbi:hypothetical protein HMPREF0762_00491 [Slackia exigua ATCC 700122]|uniref:Uncharacterized protein n=1 Tax=Slackia exigua (strain ATCC 700122 / DSM 15923 / CIP 105133 / JCM 11022 / KCTC 5966 / S-7) TaxID=649764 RepID=D0WFH2_SLAES|nr:hypothetical protein HMPREF0762_00491 [Slackia exigua ATCC 700122]